MRSATTIAITLAALVVLALGLRLGGLDKLQPYLEEADPGLVVQVKLLREGITPDPVAHKAYLAYPTLLARCVAPLDEARAEPAAPLAEHLAAASADFVRMRGWIALLATLLVPLTWSLARRFLGPVGALTAAASVALSLLHLLFSQQARPHGAHASVALAAVLAHLGYLRRPTLARGALSATLCAVAIACLHTGVFTLPPLAVAWWLARREAKRASIWPALATLPLSAAAFWLFYPRGPRLENDGGTLEYGGHTLHFDKLDFSGFRTFFEVLATYDPALLAAAALGLIVALSRMARWRAIESGRRAELTVVLAYALPYLLAVGVFGETVDRFLLPLVPYLALLVGVAVESVRRPALQLALAVLALAFPSYATLRYVAVRGAPDTFELAAQWLRDNADPRADRVLASPRMTLPVFLDAESLAFAQRDGVTRKRPWITYLLDERTPTRSTGDADTFALFLAPAKLVNQQPPQADASIAALLDETRPRFVLVEVSKLTTTVLPGVVALRDEVARRGRLVTILSGEGVDACVARPIDYQEIDDFLARILRARAFGPCVEIYELPVL